MISNSLFFKETITKFLKQVKCEEALLLCCCYEHDVVRFSLLEVLC